MDPEVEALRARIRELEGLLAERDPQLREAGPARVRVGDLTLDLTGRRATLAAVDLELLPREFAVLAALARSPGEVVSASVLHRTVWGRDPARATNVLAMHVSRLRAKLGNGAVRVITRRGGGYLLVSDPATPWSTDLSGLVRSATDEGRDWRPPRRTDGQVP